MQPPFGGALGDPEDAGDLVDRSFVEISGFMHSRSNTVLNVKLSLPAMSTASDGLMMNSPE